MMRFQSEYLQELQKRTKNFLSSRNLLRGDVVIRMNDKTRQNPWPLARVEETIVSKDGKVRSCWVRLPIDLNKPVSKKNKNKKPTPRIVKRGVENLCLLEQCIIEKDLDKGTKESDNTVNINEQYAESSPSHEFEIPNGIEELKD